MFKILMVKNNKGFTLIELLISISVIIILTASIIPGFNGYIKNQNLRQAQEQIKNDLRTVQNNALTGVDSLNTSPLVHYWGASFINNSPTFSYVTSTNPNCNSLTSKKTTSTLPAQIVVRSVSPNSCLLFDLQKGNTTIAQNYVVKVGYAGSTGNSCLQVLVNSSGLITSPDGLVSCT